MPLLPVFNSNINVATFLKYKHSELSKAAVSTRQAEEEVSTKENFLHHIPVGIATCS